MDDRLIVVCMSIYPYEVENVFIDCIRANWTLLLQSIKEVVACLPDYVLACEW